MTKTCTPLPPPPQFWLLASGKLVSMVHSLIVTSAAFRRPLGHHRVIMTYSRPIGLDVTDPSVLCVRSDVPEAFCYPKRNWKIEEYIM